MMPKAPSSSSLQINPPPLSKLSSPTTGPAITHTWSREQVPRFVGAADKLKAKGGRTMAWTSVNDAFGIGAWGQDQKAGDKVVMVGDGNGEFTQAMGLTMDGSKFGLGTRSQRY